MTGKEFESLLLWRARTYDEPLGLYTMGRYGVMAVMHDNEWRPIKSLPDFEGVMPGGHQFIFDAKTCSQPSYALSGGTSKSLEHQYKHMRRRAKFGVLCFLLIHFNARTLKTREDPAFTAAIAIRDSPLWESYDRGELKTITRDEALRYGQKVPWNKPGTARTEAPDLNYVLTNLKKENCNG